MVTTDIDLALESIDRHTVPIIHIEENEDFLESVSDELLVAFDAEKNLYRLYSAKTLIEANQVLTLVNINHKLPPVLIVDLDLRENQGQSDWNGLFWLLEHMQMFRRQNAEIFVLSANLTPALVSSLLSSDVSRNHIFDKEHYDEEKFVVLVRTAIEKIKKLISAPTRTVSRDSTVSPNAICQFQIYLAEIDDMPQPVKVVSGHEYSLVLEVTGLPHLDLEKKISGREVSAVCVCSGAHIRTQNLSVPIPPYGAYPENIEFKVNFDYIEGQIQRIIRVYVHYRNRLITELTLLVNIMK